MSGLAAVVLALTIVLISWITFFPSRPKLVQQKRGEPLESAGPTLASCFSALTLDGLTVIPVVHLPPIKLAVRLPFTTNKLRLTVSPSSSEVVFRSLHVSSMAALSLDAGRQVVGTQLRGIDADLKGNFGMKVTIQYGQKTLLRLNSAGTVDMHLDGAEADLVLRFIQSKAAGHKQNTHSLALDVRQSQVREGLIKSARFEGFSGAGMILTRTLPWLRGTILVRWPIQTVSDYLIRETLEGPVTDEILEAVQSEFNKHVDASRYSGMNQVARQEGLKLPFNPSSLESKVSEPASFKFYGHLVGPTSLINFRLPDFSPELYRPGGRRALIQSFNLLTEEVKVDITDSAFEHIKFERGSLAFDSTLGSTGSVGEIVVSVDQLEVALTSSFKVAAETKGLMGWATGLSKVGEKGVARTVVSARTLQISFSLTRKTDSEAKLGGSAFKLVDSSISPFTSVVPTVTLSNKYLNMGSELFNMVAASLQTQIAQATSFVIQQFMKELVRKRLQKGLDGIEERLANVGVELPSSLRNNAPEQ